MLHMRKTHNLSAECEMASADFRNIAPSMVQGFVVPVVVGGHAATTGTGQRPPWCSLRCIHLPYELMFFQVNVWYNGINVSSYAAPALLRRMTEYHV